MFLSSQTERVISQLKQCSELDTCSIIKAYPFVNKPSKINRAIITVSPSELSAKAVSLSRNDYFATYSIDTDVFVPQEEGSPFTSDIIESITFAVSQLKPVKVEISGVEANDALECFSAKCSFSFSEPINLRRNDYGE